MRSPSTLVHLVLLKKSPAATAEKMEAALAGARALEHLDCVDWIAAGDDVSVEEAQNGFTHAVAAGFASPLERDRYLASPEHRAVGDELSRCVDEVAIVDIASGAGA
jgi:hypothetical protein